MKIFSLVWESNEGPVPLDADALTYNTPSSPPTGTKSTLDKCLELNWCHTFSSV
jgi:hypothetical protein